MMSYRLSKACRGKGRGRGGKEIDSRPLRCRPLGCLYTARLLRPSILDELRSSTVFDSPKKQHHPGSYQLIRIVSPRVLEIKSRAIVPHHTSRHVKDEEKQERSCMETRLGNTLSLQIDQTRRPRSSGHDDPLCEVPSPVFGDHADTSAG
jgi:hypothetical protein